LFYPSEADEAARVRTFIVIAIPVVVRMALAAIASRLGGDSRSLSLGLLPQAPRPLLAFLCAALMFTLGSLLFENDHTGLGRYDAVAFFSLYLICSTVAALSSLGRMREAERLLRQFVAMDLGPLKQRVSGSTRSAAAEVRPFAAGSSPMTE
jgi:hypothetical protein